jgi:hypothetical protein
VPGGAALITPSNYTLNYVKGNLVVNKFVLKAAARDTFRLYGSPNPVFAINYSGFVNGDDASKITTKPVASTPATATSPVGKYTINVSGGVAANYTFNDSIGTLTIKQAPLTATADNKSKLYGDPNPALTITYSGFLNGDLPSCIITPPAINTTATTASAAGTYPITLTGGAALNYSITDVNGVMTVGPAPLSVKANDLVIDDDASLPAFTSTITGFKNGDNSTTAISSGPVYTVNPVYKKEQPGIYTVTPSALVLKKPGNYAIIYLPGTLYVNEEEGTNCSLALTCVKALTNDPSGFKYLASFTFKNPNPLGVYVPIGSNNSLTSSGKFSGQQPQMFPSGSGSFSIYFDGSPLTWSLIAYVGNNKTSVTASSSSKKCSGTQTTAEPGGAVGGGSTAETAETPATLETIDPVATVYPNPAKGLVTIHIRDGNLSPDNIQLSDAYGKMYVANAKILSAQSLQVDLSRLSSGMYFIRVKVGSAYQVFRVVKM